MKLVHDFNEVVNRINTESQKWDDEGGAGKYIPLSVADMDFKTAQPIIDALRQKVDFGVYAYGYLPQKRFASAVSGWYQKRYGLNVSTEWVRYSQGLMTAALWMILDAYTRPGDKVLIQTPVYNTFGMVIEGKGRFVETNPLIRNGNRYEIDFDDLKLKLKDPWVRILLMCNPHNPVGRVWTREELTRIYELCKENDVLIVSDEVHGDLVYGEHEHIPFFSVCPDEEDHVIVMSGPSKTFNLAAMYSSYVLIKNSRLRAQYDVVFRNYHSDYNVMGMEALITAYNECDYYVDQLKDYLWGNITYVKEFLGANMPEVQVIEPESTYLLWIDFSAWKLNQYELMNFFTDCGVRVNDGEHYGENGSGFIRLNTACHRSVLERAMECIKKKYDSDIKG